MVEADEVEECCVEVGHGDLVFGDVVTELVSLPVGHAPSDTSSGKPDTEGMGMVVATIIPLRGGRAAEFGAEDHEGVVEQASGLEILE